MKSMKIFMGGVVMLTLLTLSACDEKPIEEQHDDAYYAAQATIGSEDQSFTATEDGGEIKFATEGGEVVINVSCEIEWTVENHSADLFDAEWSCEDGTLTITAGQNTVEDIQTGTMTIYTVSSLIKFATITITQNAYGAPEITIGTDEWNAPAVGALTTQITVEATAEWSAESDEDWLTVEKTDTGLTLTATENEDTDQRSAEVEVTSNDGIKSTTATIIVVQDGLAYLTLGEESIDFDGNAGEVSVTVESNFDWTCSVDNSYSWLTATKDGNSLTIAVTANESFDEREGTITVTAGDGAENVAQAQIAVTQLDLNTLILTYTISEANSTVKIPVSGDDLDCTVDWGDGSELEAVTTAQPSHVYAEVGEYDVRIMGTVSALTSKGIWISNNVDNPGDRLTAVKQWGNTGLTSMYEAFYHCNNLTSLPKNVGKAFENVTTFEGIFYNCTSLKEIPENLFDDCPNVTEFKWLFHTCSALETIPEKLFANCPQITIFYADFYECTSLTSIPENLFSNCPLAEQIYFEFGYCSALTTIPEKLFANNPLVTSFYDVFYGCTLLESIPAGLFANNPIVDTFYGAFASCSTLTEIPKGLFDNNTEVTNFRDLFYNCKAIVSVPTDLFDNCRNVTSFYRTFYNFTSWTGESPYTEINGTKVHLYERANYPDDFETDITSDKCFYGCKLMSDYSSVPSGWR